MAIKLDPLAKAKIARCCGNETNILKFHNNPKDYLLCESCIGLPARILVENERREIRHYFCSSKCISRYFDKIQENNPDYVASEIRSEHGQITVQMHDEFESIFQQAIKTMQF